MSNIVTSVGVFLILIAYFGNSFDYLTKNKVYYTLNTLGSIFAGCGAFSVQLWPVVFLELVWATISIIELTRI